MRRNKKKHVCDYKYVIEEAIKRLPNGESRLSLSEFPLGYACLNDFLKPDFSEQIMSDYGISISQNNDVESDYFEEIKLLEQLLEEFDIPIDLADWQKSKSDTGEKLYRSFNIRAYAMQLWDWFAIPWRFKNENIHVIWPPQDAMGTPIVYSLHPSEFLLLLADIRQREMQLQEKQEKKLNFWMTLGQIFLLVTFTWFLMFLAKLFA